MKSSKMVILVLLNVLIGSATITAKTIAKDSEIETRLEFFEYELEDFCVAKNDAEWMFLNGTVGNLTKLLDAALKESEFYKKELELMQKHMGKEFNRERLQRLVDVFSHLGAPLLGNAEFKEYRDYSVKLYEMMVKMKIENPFFDNTTSEASTDENKFSEINYNRLNNILYSEKSEHKLKEFWVKWFEEVERKNKKTKYDFVQQLSILDLEAEQNGEEELSEYWLKMTDTTWVNYDTIKTLWEDIMPLYNKLKHFMISLAFKNFGKDVLLPDSKLIPAHILGSLESHDWVTAAEKLGAFDRSDAYKELKLSLAGKGYKELYRLVDDLTPELGNLSPTFYEKSRFNVTSPHCRNKMTEYCEKNHKFEVIVCDGYNKDQFKLKEFIKIAENTMKMKYIGLSAKEEEQNGFLFREGPRDSALYEAAETLSALLALQPENLLNQGLVGNSSREKQKILGLIVTALHVLPPLPYYLSGDLWRINALKEIDSSAAENEAETTLLPAISPLPNNQNGSGEPYDTLKTYGVGNLTSDWWNFRGKFQGIGPPDGKPHEDYLEDLEIIWNKPYISKFLGTLLQFQIMEQTSNVNETQRRIDLAALMRKGKSKPWQELVEETYNITEISAEPLLRYFKPLETFLDKGIKFKDDTEIFTTDDFNFLPLSHPLKPGTSHREASTEGPGESSDTLFFSLVVIAAVGVVAVIVSIGRRRYKKRQRVTERKRRLADL